MKTEYKIDDYVLHADCCSDLRVYRIIGIRIDKHCPIMYRIQDLSNACNMIEYVPETALLITNLGDK